MDDCECLSNNNTYRWIACNCTTCEYYKVYVKREMFGFTWWSRINKNIELVSVDEVKEFIKEFEDKQKGVIA